jgi:hypothetical protein
MFTDDDIKAFARNGKIRREAVSFLVRQGMKREDIGAHFQSSFGLKVDKDLQRIPVGDWEEKCSNTTRETKLLYTMCSVLLGDSFEGSPSSQAVAAVCAGVLQPYFQMTTLMLRVEGFMRGLCTLEDIESPPFEVTCQILQETCEVTVRRYGTAESVDTVEAFEKLLYLTADAAFTDALQDNEEGPDEGEEEPIETEVVDEVIAEDDPEEEKVVAEEDDEHVMPRPD